MAAITNGAELVAKLRASKTGKDKLAIAVALLEKTGGGATAGEIVAELGAKLGEQHVTVEKARQFAATGEYVGLRKAETVPPEAKYLPPKPMADEKDDGKAATADGKAATADGKAATVADPATAQTTVGPTVGPAPVRRAEEPKLSGGQRPAAKS